MDYEELKAKFETARAAGMAICERAKAEGRDLTDGEQAQVLGYVTEAKGYDDRARKIKADSSVRGQLEALGFTAPADTADLFRGDGSGRLAVAPTGGKSLGRRFWDSPEWQATLKAQPGGKFSDSAQARVGSTQPVAFRGVKDLLTGASDTSAGALIVNDRDPMVTPYGRRPLALRDIITQGSTDSDAVDYVSVVSETNNAAPVAEATDAGGSSGAKPQSNLTLVKETTNVKTLAHWLAATKRALSDAGQLATLIDGFLRFGLEEELEDQMIAGDGVGENFLGLKNVSGTQDQAWDTNILVTARKAKTKVQVIGRARPTAYLLHPNDWERFELSTNTGLDFYGGGPFGAAPDRLWQLPVVLSEAVTEGTGWCGAFNNLVLWDRQEASIQTSDSHSDFFTRNLVAILAEMRAAYGNKRPVAFVEMDLTA